jgi:hypothetical protein
MRRPRGDRRELLLADVVVEPAAVLADAAAEHQRHDAGPIGEVGVVPVVDAGPDDDGAFAAGRSAVVGPLAGEAHDGPLRSTPV